MDTIKFTGVVAKHLGRGKELGFPTANIVAPEGIEEGIYLARANGNPSLVFIGNAKTFGEDERQAEVYLLNFSGDLYGQGLEVELIQKIRENERFDSIDELVVQMKKDEEEAKRYFVL